jgi:C1A family cysteine protease
VNWVAKGVVGGVQDQGNCGASYAFSATGAVQSAYAIKGLGLQNLSE